MTDALSAKANTMSDASDVLATFAPIARCERRTFTKARRGTKAVQWCAWCKRCALAAFDDYGSPMSAGEKELLRA